MNENRKHSTFLRLPRLFGDGMVLQRNAPIRVWGWAEPGQAVTIRFLGKDFRTAADAAGSWSADLPEAEAGGPYEMEFEADRKITVKDVLVGEVWVCSGQSNMELPMNRVKDHYPDEIAASENPTLRLFYVEKEHDFQKEREDLTSGSWISADPQSVLNFSAAAYFFADEIHKVLRVPVGVISASVGGSPVEAWLSRASLSLFPHYREIAEQMENERYVEAVRERDTENAEKWNRRLNGTDPGLSGLLSWYDPYFDDSGWDRMTVPGSWEDEGFKLFNGSLWFRREIELPEGANRLPARLNLGAIVDADRTYVNGVPVGETAYRYPPRHYGIPAGVLKQGKNVIAVRVVSFLGKGGFVKGKDYTLETGGRTLNLAGPWRFRVGARMNPLPEQVFFDYQPGGLYNAMISPLLNYAVKGILWYQGESSMAHPSEYEAMFRELIRCWRQNWRLGELPFLYVQLANYGEIAREPAESDWAAVRQAQLNTLKLPKTGMAVAADVGEWNDLHPYNKKEVGRRLALAARTIAYGDRSVTPMGPVFDSVRREGNRLFVGFRYAERGLTVQNGEALSGFELCGDDCRFHKAEAVIEGNRVAVRCAEIEKPEGVRYAWADSPEALTLYSRAGLPASPFEAYVGREDREKACKQSGKTGAS